MPVTLPHGLIYPIATSDPVADWPGKEQINYGILDASARMIWYVGGDNHLTQNAYYDTVQARWEYWAAAVATRLTLRANGDLEFYDAPAGALVGDPITWTLRYTLKKDGSLILEKLTGAPANPGVDKIVLYCFAGSTVGLSLRGKAGATGAEFFIQDDLPV